MKTLLLSNRDVEEIVRRAGCDRLMDELVERLASAFESFDDRVTEIPARRGFSYRSPSPGLIEWMPLMSRGSEVVLKVVGYHPENPLRRNLPTILSTISAYDTESGRLRALADGTLLTAMRTGAASAVASRWLASPESRTLGLIGCGAQSVTQAHAIGRSFDIREIVIHDVDPAAEASFGTRIEGLLPAAPSVRAAAPEEVAAEVDILCVATSIGVGEGPVFAACETRPWLHVNAVGSDFPGKIELPLELLRSSFVCPDFPAQALHEGECQQLEPEAVDPSIVHVAQGGDEFSSQRAQRTVFDSTGWALEDQVALDLALEYAQTFGLGSQVQIEGVGDDPINPYAFHGRGGRSAEFAPLDEGACSLEPDRATAAPIVESETAGR